MDDRTGKIREYSQAEIDAMDAAERKHLVMIPDEKTLKTLTGMSRKARRRWAKLQRQSDRNQRGEMR